MSAPSASVSGCGPGPAVAAGSDREDCGWRSGLRTVAVTLRAGVAARLTFVRTSDKTCGTEMVFPSLNIKRALPLNEPVVIEFTPKTGELAFPCGMNMLKGVVVVSEERR